MQKGVTLEDPDSTVIDSTVRIGADTTIGPFSLLLGETRVGKGCTIFSHSIMQDTHLEDGATAGPMAVFTSRRIRKG